MSGIRVTYSGLISFIISLTGVFTGLVFTIIVTRRLSPEEFGTWSLIGGLVTYVLIIEPMISYWTTREIARGQESGRTAVVSSGVFSGLGVIAYLIIAFLVGSQVGVNLEPLFLATLLVPVMFLTKTLNAINHGWRPHAISFGMLAFELTKIPVALLLVYFMDFGLNGAIVATVIAYLSNIIILLKYAKPKLKEKFSIKSLKKWLKLSWLPTYPASANFLYTLDVAVYSTITGSVVGLAYWGVANTIANIVGQSGNISRALYAKLLEGGRTEHVQENLSLSFYFAIPLAALAITFAKPGLFVLNPLYIIVYPIVIILTVRIFLDLIAGIYSTSLAALEKVDVNEKSTFKDYVRSKLFVLPTVRIIQFGSYTAFLALMLFFVVTKNELELIIYWGFIFLGAQVLYTVFLQIMARKNITIKVDYIAIVKYGSVCILLFGGTFLLMEEYLVYEESIFIFLPSLLPYIAICVLGYLGITYLIDQRTRILFKAILKEIR